MSLLELFEESINVLKTNKMRTALSTLGIIIGIGSVITLVTLGQASQANIKTQIQALGSNLLTIRPGAQRQGFIFSDASNSAVLTYKDALAIKESNRITTINKVAADYSSRTQVSYERNNSNVSVVGVAGDYFILRNITISLGSEITNELGQTSAKIAVLGPTVAEDLFGAGVNPLGKSINIESQTFKVIGVTKSKGIDNLDEAVFIPLQTAQKVLFGVSHVSTIYVGAISEELMEPARNQIGYLLLEQHRKKLPSDADFSISSQEDILETANEITGTFTTLLAGIAAISLIVGGIGIMNIMLVTVTERTSEIGLRKALGAKRRTIIIQFLMESIVLTIIGGIIGVTLGISVSFILTKYMSLPSVLSWESIILAVVVSSAIGIVFGLYPAIKASKLQPIEALRYE
ncbi:MAG: Macrolide efflux ABC transporter, permease/ATP-binding protein [uncultured bacterium]|nr:MAG: Macrolide efflux ABC transporter, permease/ATP-binding protein [uncultured bacterium]